MSVDRIETLHQEASEHYLNGRFDEAIRAWQQVLSLDPAHEQALEGVRMSSLLGEGGSAENEPRDAGLDADIDAGLKVFDFERETPEAMGSPPPTDGPVGDLPDPTRQADGIDFGDIEEVEAIPLAEGETPSEPDVVMEEEVGLAPVAPKLPGTDPALAELKRRVGALLNEARAKADAGSLDEALSILGRVQVLDEENPEARELERQFRNATEQASGEIDRWMIEGVQSFEGGMYDEARGWFLKVLGRVPEHAEAQHYLTEIGRTTTAEGRTAATPAGGSGDLLSSFLEPSEPQLPGESAVGFPNLGPSPGAAEEIPLARPEPAATPAAPLKRTAPRRPAPEVARAKGSRRWIFALVGVAGVGAVAAAAWLVLSGEGGSPAEAGPATLPRAQAPETREAPREAQPSESAPLPPVGVSVSRGRAAMSRRDYEGAILAFHDALRVDPANADAAIGMTQATEAYKAVRAHQEQIDGIRGAFEDGEYASALRVLYRLPGDFDRATVERWKVNGWFNLAVVALRAGEVPQALQHLDEALSIQDDEDARKWKAFAQRYANLPKDRTYYAATESLPFRSLDD